MGTSCKRGKRLALAIISLSLIISLPGCEINLNKRSAVEETSVEIEEQTKGSGEIVYEKNVTPLQNAQESLLLAYMDFYYDSLAYLRLHDPGKLFSDETQATLSRSNISFQIGLRQMQNADYSLTAYHYTLTCLQTTEEVDGTISILAEEESVQNFAQCPEIDSESYGISHHFTLTNQNGKWYIKRHEQDDTLSVLLSHAEEEDANLTAQYIASVPEYLELVQNGKDAREKQRGKTAPSLSAEHAYDGKAALDYAARYVKARNDNWEDYSLYGGNCQNFVSQCLLAGGIPMDSYGESVWKWYGSAVSNRSGTSGRSSSWSSVNRFIEYAKNNTGYGLVAIVGAPYFTGEPGDLIQMGTEKDWQHTVIISSVVQDDEGNPVDYLVHSNTGDAKNFPASLFGFSNMSLTVVVGWNS